MNRHLRLSRILTASVFFVTVAPARAQNLTKAEIGKLGKAASVFVELTNHTMGTGFCVHSSGLFITNHHVIRGAEKGEITLVVNSSLPDQQVLRAKVVRSDQNLDLALLRVDKPGELTSLPLGSIGDVAELMDVFAFGFPLGKRLATDRKDYPAISINAGHVSAVRRKENAVEYIQVDVVLNPGNSGGPIIDEKGKVVGVVVSRAVGATGINQAIPVNHLSAFLNAPDISFAPRN